jgi:hypothetical protein
VRSASTAGSPQDHDAYQKALERLLRDLKVEASPGADG